MKIRNRLLALALVLVTVLSIMPISASALDKLALSAADAKKLLNSVELHSQRTGYKELDDLMESILEPFKNADTYTKNQGCI